MVSEQRTAVVISVESLNAFCLRVLGKLGVSSEDARTTTEVLVTTDTWGVFTHGTKLLAGYAKRLQGGGLRVDCSPRVAIEGPAWAIVDGQSTLGQVASTFAMKCAIEKARKCGVAYVGVRNSCHFGAAGYYAWLAARENMIGLAMANDVPSVAAPGSRGAVIGSNPIAYAIPAGDRDPLLLDISIATVAGGRVYARSKRGESIPEGWLIGPDGRPTTDGGLYPGQASLAPMSGHKGYGIGLLIESLSGVITGAAVTKQVGSWLFDDPALPTDHGAAFIVIDHQQMMQAPVFAQRMAALIDEIHQSPVADSSDRILMPGEREWEHRRRVLKNGISLPEDVIGKLEEVATEVGIDLPLR